MTNTRDDAFPIAYAMIETFCNEKGYTFEFERDTWEGEEVAQIEIDGPETDEQDDFCCVLHDNGQTTMTEFNLDGVTDEFRKNIDTLFDSIYERLNK